MKETRGKPSGQEVLTHSAHTQNRKGEDSLNGTVGAADADSFLGLCFSPMVLGHQQITY